MPVPVVIVEIAPPNAPPVLARTLVAACSRAVERGRCSLVTDEPDDVVPQAIAIVSWEGADELRVRIEVGIRRTERAQWLSRTMSFRAEDDPAERWKAAGLTVATLVGQVAPPAASVGQPAPSGTAPVRAAQSAARVAPEKPTAAAHAGADVSRAQFEGGLRAGPGLESGSLRLGAVAAVGYQPAHFPVQPWLCGGYAAQAAGSQYVGVAWTNVGVGASMDFAVTGQFGLRFRSELMMQRVGVTATDRAGGSSESGAAWKTGWLLGVDTVWPAGGAFAVTAGVDAWTTSGRVFVRVSDRTVGTEPIFGWAGRLGVRVRVP